MATRSVTWVFVLCRLGCTSQQVGLRGFSSVGLLNHRIEAGSLARVILGEPSFISDGKALPFGQVSQIQR